MDNPKLAGVDLSGVGQPERAPLLVTKTLLFSGDGSGMFSSGPNGGGPLFRELVYAALARRESRAPHLFVVDEGSSSVA